MKWLFLLISLQTFASSLKYCPHQTNFLEIKEMTLDMAKVDYPDLYPLLVNKTIIFHEFESQDYFFKVFIKQVLKSMTMINKDKWKYRLDINKNIYNCSPSKEALTAILSHELGHIEDMVNMKKKKQFIALGLKILTRKKFNEKYEKETDLKAIKRGHTEGLIAYRNWIYKNIPKKKLTKKMRIYYTPEQLREISHSLKK